MRVFVGHKLLHFLFSIYKLFFLLFRGTKGKKKFQITNFGDDDKTDNICPKWALQQVVSHPWGPLFSLDPWAMILRFVYKFFVIIIWNSMKFISNFVIFSAVFPSFWSQGFMVSKESKQREINLAYFHLDPFVLCTWSSHSNQIIFNFVKYNCKSFWCFCIIFLDGGLNILSIFCQWWENRFDFSFFWTPLTRIRDGRSETYIFIYWLI